MHTAQHQVQRVSHLEKSKNGIVLIVDPSGIIAFWTLSAWRAKPRSCGKRSCKNCVLKKGRVLKVLNLISKRWKNQFKFRFPILRIPEKNSPFLRRLYIRTDFSEKVCQESRIRLILRACKSHCIVEVWENSSSVESLNLCSEQLRWQRHAI